MVEFAKQTKENECVCPYCGNDCGWYMSGSDEARYRCDACGEEYYVQFNPDSWDDAEGYYAEVEDVTDRHRKSLLEG